MVPSAHFRKGGFHADIGFDQSRDLLQPAAEFTGLAVLQVGAWSKGCWFDVPDDLHRRERVIAGAAIGAGPVVVAYMLSRMLAAS